MRNKLSALLGFRFSLSLYIIVLLLFAFSSKNHASTTPQIAEGSGEQFSVALKSDGTVWAWGHLPQFPQTYINPIQIDISNAIAIAVGGGGDGLGHCLMLKSDGTVWAWGRGVESRGSKVTRESHEGQTFIIQYPII